MKLQTKVAYVTGANGISGNAIIEHLIRQPESEWSKIVISSRSPLPYYWQDHRVEFVAIDYLDPLEDIIKTLQDICKDVTHAFFTSYVHVDDFKSLRDKNEPLFQNFLDSLERVAPDLEHVCLQTGGKHYGGHLRPVKVPSEESIPRYEDRGENFYYAQEDYLFALQKKSTWSHSIIRPNAIIGFTPRPNGMGQAVTLALYFLICQETGEPGIFPGNQAIWNMVDDSSYAPGIADMSVWASTTEQCKNEAFNHVNGDVIQWRYFWPQMAAHFGLNPPEPDFTASGASGTHDGKPFSMVDWAKDKRPYWEAVCEKYGGDPKTFDFGTWGFFDWTVVGKTWLTLGTNNKARKYGWGRVDDTVESWIKTFKSFEHAGILPSTAAILAEEKAKSLPVGSY